MNNLVKGLSGIAPLAIALLGSTTALPVRAAESFDNCTGFIDSLPASVSTQGTWCLRHDLATSMASGNAITVATNNVTIDCNNYKVGGTAAGASTATIGIAAENRVNTTVRHCNIRGFRNGIALTGTTGGNVVQDNRFDGNTYNGLVVAGDGSLIQRNQVVDTGGAPGAQGIGIWTYGNVDVLDNTVSGMATANTAYGIYTDSNFGGVVAGNRVRGLVPATSTSYGIYNLSAVNVSVYNNVVVGTSLVSSIGLRCTSSDSTARDNFVYGFTTSIVGCRDDGNSL
ncbi:right-handed parallel beta-helix repeat-containing protein [Cognatiluteimonas telluris]|jgi:parallel beta-helix repeat protein|uniref:right-handed parallel beta-helix repeat-containing protein n=1 Tax=Cognatiluteimonas telluris TaxID=1104775 RepID=UPI00140B4D63|nr:right-handed parallel beta-helix repeat-containing protein [Lysobacter telluris]